MTPIDFAPLGFGYLALLCLYLRLRVDPRYVGTRRRNRPARTSGSAPAPEPVVAPSSQIWEQPAPEETGPIYPRYVGESTEPLVFNPGATYVSERAMRQESKT